MASICAAVSYSSCEPCVTTLLNELTQLTGIGWRHKIDPFSVRRGLEVMSRDEISVAAFLRYGAYFAASARAYFCAG